MTQEQINQIAHAVRMADDNTRIPAALAMVLEQPVRPEPKDNMDKFLMGRLVA